MGPLKQALCASASLTAPEWACVQVAAAALCVCAQSLVLDGVCKQAGKHPGSYHEGAVHV